MLPSIIFQEYLKEHLSTHHLQTAKPSPQDDSSILHLSPTQIVALRLSPKLFGHPNSRDRAWRILFRKGVKKWSCNHTFQELADIILMDKKDDLLLDYGCYLFETKMDPEYGTITEDELARRSCMIMIFKMKNLKQQCFQYCVLTWFPKNTIFINTFLSAPISFDWGAKPIIWRNFGHFARTKSSTTWVPIRESANGLSWKTGPKLCPFNSCTQIMLGTLSL